MSSPLQPIYTTQNLTGVAYALRYSWMAWPSSGELPPPLPQEAWQELKLAWEDDGLRVLETRWTSQFVQITFSTTPQVSPETLASRTKGRLQHALRKHGTPVDFSRKLSLRAVGVNSTEEVKQYILSQARSEGFCDSQFVKLLESLRIADPAVDISQPTETRSGRYWYDLHLVLVANGRFSIGEESQLRVLRDGCVRIAANKGYVISTLSMMPDHFHLALRGNIALSPGEIALTFLNNLAYFLGQNAIWQFGYYVATFGEYRMDAVRQTF